MPFIFHALLHTICTPAYTWHLARSNEWRWQRKRTRKHHTNITAKYINLVRQVECSLTNNKFFFVFSFAFVKKTPITEKRHTHPTRSIEPSSCIFVCNWHKNEIIRIINLWCILYLVFFFILRVFFVESIFSVLSVCVNFFYANAVHYQIQLKWKMLFNISSVLLSVGFKTTEKKPARLHWPKILIITLRFL